MPRADFECKKCQATYEDLPLESQRCPVCGLKRGFRRLYNRINVATASRSGPQVGEFPKQGPALRRKVDEMIQPMLERRQALLNGRQQAEAAAKAAQEQVAATGAQQRRVPITAEGWQGMIPNDSKLISRSLNLPIFEQARRRGGPRPIFVNSDPSPS